jgi:amino-acid N-acetyltransferase
MVSRLVALHSRPSRTYRGDRVGGEAAADSNFANLIHDIALLHGLGMRVVLAHGARPQVEERLQLRGAEMRYVDGLRITDDHALTCVKEAAGAVRVEIEGLLSTSMANSPMAGARIRALSGNFVTAKPIGIRNGIDYRHTGEVRRVDSDAIRKVLDSGAVALIPPLGYSATGEVFNLSASDVGCAVATALGADKLVFLLDGKGLTDSRGRVLTSLLPADVDALLKRRTTLPEDLAQQLRNAAGACRSGVSRTHLVGRSFDGALLQELFSRDGVGTLVSAEPYETLRTANLDDVIGIMELLAPLEEQGVLVRRPREILETEIDHFSVVERDGTVIGCAALYCYQKERMAELACVVVHPDYRNRGLGDDLLLQMEKSARAKEMEQLFVLTTHTAHWFRERGFRSLPLKSLPVKRRRLYNYQRSSRVLVKKL